MVQTRDDKHEKIIKCQSIIFSKVKKQTHPNISEQMPKINLLIRKLAYNAVGSKSIFQNYLQAPQKEYQNKVARVKCKTGECPTGQQNYNIFFYWKK